MIEIIAIIALAVGVLVVLFVFFRKLPTLRAIDLSAIQKDRLAQMKDDLMTSRLRRKILNWGRWVDARTKPARNSVRKTVKQAIMKAETLEREYRAKSLKQSAKGEEVPLAKVTTMLNEAAELVKEEEYAQAEKKYIEIVSIAPNHHEAYEGLGEVYLTQKDYAHAEESLLYAAKLSPENGQVRLDLATVYAEQHRPEKALEMCKEAVTINPNDPKSLDMLIELAIEQKQRAIAEEGITKLAAANPENQKIAEFQERIAQIPPALDAKPRTS